MALYKFNLAVQATDFHPPMKFRECNVLRCVSVSLFVHRGSHYTGPWPHPLLYRALVPLCYDPSLSLPLPRHKVKFVKLPILDMFTLVQLGRQCAGCPPTSSDLYDRQVGGWHPTGMLSCFDMELVTLKCDFL